MLKMILVIVTALMVGCQCDTKDEVSKKNARQEVSLTPSQYKLEREVDRILESHNTPNYLYNSLSQQPNVYSIKSQQSSNSSVIQTNQSIDVDLINTQVRPDIASLPLGMSPAYLVGDINEDSFIDENDLVLLRTLSSSKNSLKDFRAVSCAAAADMNFDGEITDKDVSFLESLIQEGPLSSGVLYDHTIFPCQHKRSFIAFSQEPICHATLKAQLLPFSPTRGIRLDELSDGTIIQSQTLHGWNIAFEGLTLASNTPALLFTKENNYFVYWLSSFCALEPSQELSDKDWAETPIPSSEPPGRPPIYGEEIDDLKECPQKDKGCEALIIDFLAKSTLWQEPDATQTRNALKKAGCNVDYVAPKFVKVPPKPNVRLYSPSSYSSYSDAHRLNRYAQKLLTEYDKKLSKILFANVKSWQSINNRLVSHRSKIRKGAALAYQLVNAHGSEGSFGTCGRWGVGFDTGTGTLSRDKFHSGNYRAERKNVCNAVMEDRSCHSGLSANALDWLNNFSLVSCGASPRENHRRHAAFFGDMVISTAESANTCTMLNMTLKDYTTASYIERAAKDKGFVSLAQAFLVRGIGLGLNTSAFYSDFGYNQIPGKLCKGARKRY